MSQEIASAGDVIAGVMEKSPVSYEDLTEIENQFEDAEKEIIKHQVALTAPIYEKRAELVSKIENFWPLVLEQAPTDIDQFIMPSDSSVLLSSLTNISVRRFEIEAGGDPRSVAIAFEFADNEFFADKVLEKKFWHRRAADGWTGLVSEPVSIAWKKGKDLTNGLLPAVVKTYEEAKAGKGKKDGFTPAQEELAKKIEATGVNGQSFFTWFGFIGRRASAEASEEATKREAAKRKGEAVAEEDEEAVDAEDMQEELEMSLEIFPDGDDLAVAFADDLYPSAIRYFTQAQEQEDISDADFESLEGGSSEGEESEGEGQDDAPAAKKQKK